MKHVAIAVFILCSARTGLYSSTHYHPRHGWTCAYDTDTQRCTVTGPNTVELHLPAPSNLRYVDRAGGHATIHCR